VTVSGCQNWKNQILASSSSHFAFASTIAVYIYDLESLQLQKILTKASSHITALCWEPNRERYLAQASLDKKVMVWDVESEQVKFEVQLNSHPVHIEWNKANDNVLMMIQSNGEVKTIDLASKFVNHVTFPTADIPTVLRQSPSKPDVVTIGLDSGFIQFYNM
jgi:WD40 repeat protein